MSIPEISPQEAKAKLDQVNGTIYLDVRTVPEFDQGRPPAALNVPVMIRDASTGQMVLNEEFIDVVQANVPTDADIIVGCRSGGRSARATAMLLHAGYTNVVNMAGGFGGAHGPDGAVAEPGWSTLGYPVETGDAGNRAYDALRNQR